MIFYLIVSRQSCLADSSIAYPRLADLRLADLRLADPGTLSVLYPIADRLGGTIPVDVTKDNDVLRAGISDVQGSSTAGADTSNV